MSDYILEVKGLTKKFKNQIAVNNVSISIREGSVYGVMTWIYETIKRSFF